MKIRENVSLKSCNTFGINANAKLFCEVTTVEELKEALKTTAYRDNKVLWLGGGSNMLLTQNFEGLVIQLNLRGKNYEYIDENWVSLSVMAGENWHQLVLYTLENNWGGLENLSLIPGNTGTAPIQNIGAYGVELKDSFYSLNAMELATGELTVFTKEQCNFSYRESFFKTEGKGKYVITEVCFRLSRKNHQLHTKYGAISNALKEMNATASIQNISKSVISIRQSKLPDPAKIGNSGSFFKNPIVSKTEAENLKVKFPNLASYQVNEKETKLAAGWLIEQSGLKGYRKGDAGVHDKQALVLVNYGDASGEEILALAEHVKRIVFDKFAVRLEAEVNLI